MLVVYGSEARHTAGVAFEALHATGAPPAISSLQPWHLVDEQVAGWPGLSVGDEWYPMKDYEALIQADDGSWAQYVLQFDHGLLQGAIRV